MSTKNDNLRERIDSLQSEQTKKGLARLSSNVTTNSKQIVEVTMELETLKKESNVMAKTLANVLQNATSTTLELVISGIPESVTTQSTLMEIASSVFKVLNLSGFNSDIITIRKIEKKNKSGAIDSSSSSRSNRNVTNSILFSAIRFIYNLKRDEHITPYRRKLGYLSVNSRRIYFLASYFRKLLSIGKPCSRVAKANSSKSPKILIEFPKFGDKNPLIPHKFPSKVFYKMKLQSII